MNVTTAELVQSKPIIGVDLSKKVFQVALADTQRRIHSRQRLTRAKFIGLMVNQPSSVVVMEACGSAQYWARRLREMGHTPTLLPAQHVRAYVRGNKTDAADAAALVQASGCEDIKAVALKTVDQQVLQQLHRFRSRWVQGRTSRINGLRGSLREFGIDIPKGAAAGLAAIREALEIPDNGLPDALRPLIQQVLKEIEELGEQIKNTQRTLQALTAEDEVVRRMRTTPGVGLIVATAARAAINDIHRFPSGRFVAAWLGLTAKEHSSGEIRRMGGISKRGDVYLRTQLIHGARALLVAAKVAQNKGRPLDRLRSWALTTQARIGTNVSASLTACIAPSCEA
jgi:transposase